MDIQYTWDEYNRAGHLRQCRKAEERVVLVATAVWEDGSYEILHYEIATGEEEWSQFFENLIARGLHPTTVELVVSDGTLGLPKALQKNLPNAQHQSCITHKVRGIECYLSYGELPQVDPNSQSLKPDEPSKNIVFKSHLRLIRFMRLTVWNKLSGFYDCLSPIGN